MAQRKSVLITGGTSGIGRACAHEFAALGYDVVIIGRSDSRGRAIVESIVGGAACKAAFIRGDLSDVSFVSGLVPRSVEETGRLDVLVNNAGVLAGGTAIDTDDELWENAMTVNAEIPFMLSRSAVFQMRERGGGSIISIASEWGLNGQQGFLAYCASKGAVVQMTRKWHWTMPRSKSASTPYARVRSEPQWSKRSFMRTMGLSKTMLKAYQ